MFSDLADISFVDTDTSKVEQNVITMYEAITEKKLYPGDPVRLFLEALAAVIAQQRYHIDYTGKQNLLGYAQGDFLDHLGVLTDTTRLEASAAKATMQYSIAEPLGFAVLIPEGSRVTPGDQTRKRTRTCSSGSGLPRKSIPRPGRNSGTNTGRKPPTRTSWMCPWSPPLPEMSSYMS